VMKFPSMQPLRGRPRAIKEGQLRLHARKAPLEALSLLPEGQSMLPERCRDSMDRRPGSRLTAGLQVACASTCTAHWCSGALREPADG
jgi:hypothetical protein